MSTNRRNYGTGIYVDVENLGRDEQTAKNIVRYTLKDWDDILPRISRISLYGRNLNESLWKACIDGFIDEFKSHWHEVEPEVRIVNTQSFNRNQQKSVSDLCIVADAVEDMLSGSVSFVAVLTNDSDFIVLFDRAGRFKENGLNNCSAMSLIAASDRGGETEQRVPFLLINHPAEAGVSEALRLVPRPYIRTLPDTAKESLEALTDEDVAEAIIQKFDLGAYFGYAEMQEVMQDDSVLIKHTAAGYESEQFGKFVEASIWPILQSMGVARIQRQPAKYAMTEDAKSALVLEPVAEDGPVVCPKDQEVIDAIVNYFSRESRPGGGIRAWDAKRAFVDTWPDNPISQSHYVPFDNDILLPAIVRTQKGEAAKIRLVRSTVARLYEITPAARQLDEDEPGLIEMAREIMDQVSLESFSALTAQAVIQERWPNSEFAKLSDNRFNFAFFYQLWPLLSLERDAGRRSEDKPIDNVYTLSAGDIQTLKNRLSPASLR